jgi:hypothetical protein
MIKWITIICIANVWPFAEEIPEVPGSPLKTDGYMKSKELRKGRDTPWRPPYLVEPQHAEGYLGERPAACSRS